MKRIRGIAALGATVLALGSLGCDEKDVCESDLEFGNSFVGEVVREFCAQDSDGDGVPDVEDNCPDDPNPYQLDGDGDGFGNACEGTLVFFGDSITAHTYPYNGINYSYTEVLRDQLEGLGLGDQYTIKEFGTPGKTCPGVSLKMVEEIINHKYNWGMNPTVVVMCHPIRYTLTSKKRTLDALEKMEAMAYYTGANFVFASQNAWGINPDTNVHPKNIDSRDFYDTAFPMLDEDTIKVDNDAFWTCMGFPEKEVLYSDDMIHMSESGAWILGTVMGYHLSEEGIVPEYRTRDPFSRHLIRAYERFLEEGVCRPENGNRGHGYRHNDRQKHRNNLNYFPGIFKYVIKRYPGWDLGIPGPGMENQGDGRRDL